MATYEVLGDVTFALAVEMEWDKGSSEQEFAEAAEATLLRMIAEVLTNRDTPRIKSALPRLEGEMVELAVVWDQSGNEYTNGNWDELDADEEKEA